MSGSGLSDEYCVGSDPHFWNCPIPRMEVKGAAIATVIGQIVPLVMYLVWHRKKGLGVSIHIKDMKPDPAICGRLYAVGIPSSLTLGMPSLLITLLNKIRRRVFFGLCVGTGCLFQAADLPLSACQRYCAGHASDIEL